MRIPRLYHPEPIALEVPITLTPDAAHHVANVLRLKAGHPVVLFNGDGNEYSGEIQQAGKRNVVVEVDAALTVSCESALPLHLGQGISKGDRMDTVLQKSVELGVHEITPLITARCAVKLSPERWEKKHQQWQKIIISACEQSGRNRVPQLHEPITLNEWIKQSTDALRLTLAPGATTSIKQVDYHSKGYRLLIGPEGGLDDSEIHQAIERGFNAISMGPRILRTETAAISSLSVLQAMHGDW